MSRPFWSLRVRRLVLGDGDESLGAERRTSPSRSCASRRSLSDSADAHRSPTDSRCCTENGDILIFYYEFCLHVFEGVLSDAAMILVATRANKERSVLVLSWMLVMVF